MLDLAGSHSCIPHHFSGYQWGHLIFPTVNTNQVLIKTHPTNICLNVYWAIWQILSYIINFLYSSSDTYHSSTLQGIFSFLIVSHYMKKDFQILLHQEQYTGCWFTEVLPPPMGPCKVELVRFNSAVCISLLNKWSSLTWFRTPLWASHNNLTMPFS